VDYDEFITAVGERADLPYREAEDMTRAILPVLAERLSGGETEDLKAELPKELHHYLTPPQEEELRFTPDDFARRVSRSSGIIEADAKTGLIAVLAAIRDGAPGEFDDVVSELGKDFADLVELAE
jgi:uncharacterized protein (DUF2267 family)